MGSTRPTFFHTSYDAAGKLIAEYSTEISRDPKVSYTTADHLGSPRILTDENGATISRRDFHPFGEEVYTSQRTQGLGYQPDDVRQKFTSYERDDETGLDFAQARYFNSGFGRFSSPDDFLNDTRVSDPQSWNLYSYVRNNPLNMIDPFGKKAEISWYTDKEGVVHVKITASFAIYGAEGQNVSKKDLKAYKKALIDGIKAHLTKKFDNLYGKSFSVTADISAKIYKNEQKAISSKRDNIVELGYGDMEAGGYEAAAVGFGIKGENFDRMAVSIISDPLNYRGSFDPISSTADTFAHEFIAHLTRARHNSSQENSLLHGGRETDHPEFTGNDFIRLFTGYNPDLIASPPPGSSPINPVANLPRKGKETTWSHTRTLNYTSPSAFYRWKEDVKR